MTPEILMWFWFAPAVCAMAWMLDVMLGRAEELGYDTRLTDPNPRPA
jgi:hypothetical protein